MLEKWASPSERPTNPNDEGWWSLIGPQSTWNSYLDLLQQQYEQQNPGSHFSAGAGPGSGQGATFSLASKPIAGYEALPTATAGNYGAAAAAAPAAAAAGTGAAAGAAGAAGLGSTIAKLASILGPTALGAVGLLKGSGSGNGINSQYQDLINQALAIQNQKMQMQMPLFGQATQLASSRMPRSAGTGQALQSLGNSITLPT
jgi:hypothetical protein